MDLGDPDLYVSPDRFARWRGFVAEDKAVYSGPGWSPSGFWSVFSHRACQQVLSPGAPYTSEYGMLIGFDRGHPDRGGGKMIVTTDGDVHRRLRRVVGRFLKPAALQRLGRFIDAEVARLLAEAADADTVDVARRIGPVLPAAVVCELLGVPQSDRDHLIHLTDVAFASPDSDSAATATADAHTEIFLFFADLIAQRRQAPGDDLVSALLGTGELSEDEVLANCYNLLIGGNQTSRHLVCGVFHTAAEVPGLLTAARGADPTVKSLVEELIRWVSPGMHVLRVATADTVLCGQPIREGEAVVAWLAAANRDPAVFGDPDVFRWDRPANPHLSFGHGMHHCLGAQLARMELSRLAVALARLAHSVRLAGPVVPTRSNLIQGYRSLPVAIDWAEPVTVH
ncbi:cytochrome P450 [Micromonospora sp. NPDC007271]|uniref:cytochrome P450 n=1 Tax=Micromonospora sp. NPDC007271 TaxID=3154587 RepID=UPI0033D7D4E5